MNRKGLPKGMKSLIGRGKNTTIVWHETSQGKTAISFIEKTKSQGKRIILLLCTVPNLGITRGDDKPADFKVYNFTKGQTLWTSVV